MTASGYFDQNYTGANQSVTTISLTHYNYTGADQSVNTDTMDIPSLNVYNFKKIYKKRSGR